MEGTLLCHSLIRIRNQRSKIGETLLVRSVSPNPIPRTSSILSESSFFLCKNGDSDKC
jgi:hypothetical protein